MAVTLTPPKIALLLKKDIRVNVDPTTSTKLPEAPFGFEAFTNHSRSGFMPLGSYSYSHSFVREISEIGRYCSIGANLKVVQNTHPLDRVSSSPVFYSPRKLREWGTSSYTSEHVVDFEPEDTPATIGHDVWIGDDVRLRSGIHIGTGAVIAAGSIVTRDVEPYAIVAGIPAKLVRYRFDKPLIKKLLATKWWQYTPNDLMPLHPEDPKVFAASFIKAKKSIKPKDEVRLRLRQYLRGK